MQKSITINNQSLSVKEYNGQRVVTFKDIDTVHGRPEGTARRNFNSNRQHFIEGADYYKIQPNEIRTVGITSPNGGIVITLSGYLMLVKSFTDSLAWNVQRELVNTYFEAKAEQLPIYEFIEKKWKGQPVITIQDFVYFTGKQKDAVSYYLRHGTLMVNKDYYLLDGEELLKFKFENPRCNRMANSLYLITKSGFVKLLKYFGITIKTPECFALPQKFLTVPKKDTVKTIEVADVLNNVTIQKLIEKLKQECCALNISLDIVNKNRPMEDYEKAKFTLTEICARMFMDITDLMSVKPTVIEKVVK